jgi:uncharacterized protein YecE (DUF72 family)
VLPLFDPPGESASGFPRQKFAEQLRSLAQERIYFGTSSWKYEGWLDQIYSRERYLTRGRFSQKRFEDECLAEYAEVFPIVCGDFSFYQFPTDAFWSKLFGGAPHHLQFAFKVPEEITVRTFPTHPRYGPRGGMDNENFLNGELFTTGFVDALRAYRDRVRTLIFEFTAFHRRAYENVDQFLRDLDPFLAALPQDFRYAVEIRNPEFLAPEYLACLETHGVAHVLNAWTRMPELQDQLAMPGIFTTDFFVVRALLRQGRAYEDAVSMFEPYQKVQDPNPEARQALKKLVQKSREERVASYIFVNNRLEGNAPETIHAVVGPDE